MFICFIHGKYNGTTNSNACPKCIADDSKLNINYSKFIIKAKKIHKNKYSYNKFIFIDFITPGTIICKSHGDFFISPAVHILHKMGCPKCYGSISKGETEWLDYLNVQERNNILIIGSKTFRPDGIDRDRKIVYEYLGSYWHGSPLKYNPNDINKKAKKTFGKLYNDTIKREEIIKKAGYKIVKIWDYEWEDLKKQIRFKKRSKK